MHNRSSHQQQVRDFLCGHLENTHWDLALPQGRGHETYLARSSTHACFVKLGAHTARYRVMASIGLTPEVLVDGHLEGGPSIMVQPYIQGRTPTRQDYCDHLDQFAETIARTHHCAELRQTLAQVTYDRYDLAALETLADIKERWNHYRPLVPGVAGFVDESLACLAQDARSCVGGGLVASHNDICNANWLITPDGRLYLVDLEAMSMDDPALDIGATLWWYYAPALRTRFLQAAGYPDDDSFRFRMHVRMAMHCLHIILPRPGTFDEFDPVSFEEWLTDFRAAFAGEENPEGDW